MLSFQSLVLAATLLNQLTYLSAFVLPQKTSIVDSKLYTTSKHLESGNPQDAAVEEGSHEELMYTLGVNLARQLGDIRPLVENSEELTHVAKGLLDTVIGRLDDEAQRRILSKVSAIAPLSSYHSENLPTIVSFQRGKELDQLIMEVSCAIVFLGILNVVSLLTAG